MRSPRSAKSSSRVAYGKRSRQPAEWSIMGSTGFRCGRRGIFSRLWSAMAANPDADFEKLLRRPGNSPGDRSGGAQMLRMQTITYHDRYTAHNKRMHLRWAWDAFHDYGPRSHLCGDPRAEHDHSDMGKQCDRRRRAALLGATWAGMAVCSYLPSTVIPTGRMTKACPSACRSSAVNMAILKPSAWRNCWKPKVTPSHRHPATNKRCRS